MDRIGKDYSFFSSIGMEYNMQDVICIDLLSHCGG